MLVDPLFSPPLTGGQLQAMADRAGVTLAIVAEWQKCFTPMRQSTGVYWLNGFNFHLALLRPTTGNRRFELEYPSWPYHVPHLASYGVCDTPTQMLTMYDAVLTEPDRYYCVSFTRLNRKDESPKDGWRWHKWGPYIGTQKPQHEYLYDDTHIDTVWVHHVHEFTKDEIACP